MKHTVFYNVFFKASCIKALINAYLLQVRLTDRTNYHCWYVSHRWLLYVHKYTTIHIMSCSKKGRKGFANHFVLLLQFHESRNAAERKKRGVRRGEGKRAEEGERL